MKLEEIFTFEHLYQSHQSCRKSKQHKGEVIRFEANLSTNLVQLIKELNSQKYKLGKYKQFFIYEPKKRLIEAPPYKDRVVIKCFCEFSIKPKLEKRLIYDNAACRKGKGTSFAIKRLEQFLRKEYLKEKNNHIYFLKCDIKKYFPNISHNILLTMLKKIGFSEEEMWLINQLVKVESNHKEIGLTLGNQSSQWFALFYLNKIDRLIKEKLQIKYYIRYMDDMILIHRDKNYLQKCLKEIETTCQKELHLSLNQKTQIGMVKNGIDFLGYRHILTQNGVIIRKLRSSSKIRLKRHLKNLSKLKEKGIVDEEYTNIRKKAFYNHLKDTNENQYLKKQVQS